jgi:hypothetical protein
METGASTAFLAGASHRVYQRRRAPREPLDVAGVVLSDMQPWATGGEEVRIFNISTIGVGFHSPQPAAVGSIWRIQFLIDEININGRIRVTRCHHNGDGHDIGGVFIED